MPLQATSGAASYDAFGGGAAAVPQYIEDVFSTYLYTGNSTTGGTQTITNNIDLSTKGGMVWIKGRSAASNNILTDTTRGAGTTASNNQALSSNLTTAEDLAASYDFLSAFNATGFSVTQGGTTTATRGTNYNNVTYASWTFRKQPKFFDVVTYTGTGANRTIAHSLGSVPGSIIVKRTDTSADWAVYHRSLANTQYLVLNSTAAATTGATWWNSTTPTSSVFSLGTNASVNASGGTYVAYIYAHDAGGFGLTGTDNVVSCGSYTGNALVNGPVVTLGYEPQWVMIKRVTGGTNNWVIIDDMRRFVVTPSNSSRLYPNLTNAEETNVGIQPLATGFQPIDSDSDINATGQTYIYIAIRRGPMKVPTSGTSVFGLNARTGTGANATVTGGQTDDAVLIKNRGSAVASLFSSRLTGTGYLVTSDTDAEVAAGTTILQANPWDVMDGVKVGTTSTITNASSSTYINYLFKRAPSFFDEVCYTGTGSATTQTHNLGVVPELIIVKRRDAIAAWDTYCSALANTEYLVLNSTASKATGATRWNSTTPTSFVFSVGTSTTTNASAGTYVAYLFATCAGVSKVGSYTGNGSTQTIDCGFTGGARFVLIKRTDSMGSWITYDTARGMTVLTDPYWLLNTTAAETATLGSVTTVSTGFALDSTILAAINVNAGTYVFLAIA